jgi:hypothetical protein
MRLGRAPVQLAGILVLAVLFVAGTKRERSVAPVTSSDGSSAKDAATVRLQSTIRELQIGMDGREARRVVSVLERADLFRRVNAEGEYLAHENYRIGSDFGKLLQVEYRSQTTAERKLEWRLANWWIDTPTPRPQLADVLARLRVGMTSKEVDEMILPWRGAIFWDPRSCQEFYDIGPGLELDFVYNTLSKWKVGNGNLAPAEN